MGRAVRPRRERLSRNSTGPTRALSLRPCRSAGPASCPSFSGGLSRLPRAAVRLTLAGLLLVGAGTVAAPAFADVLVKNISKSQTNAPSVDSSYPGRAQAFTTGNHSDGYRLTSVEVALPNAPGASADITVTIRADSSGSPSSSIFATLTNPSDVATDGTKQFSAPTGTILAANRTYWVYLQRNSGTFSVSETASDDEDSGGATGWSIGNDHKYIASNDTAGTSSHSLRIGVNGVMIRDVEKIEVTSTPTSGTTPKKYGAGEKFQVTVTFDEAVTVTGDPEFEIKLGNSGQAVAKRAAYISGSGSTALVFEYTVLATDMDDNGIWIEADALKLDSDDLIQDGDGNNKDLSHSAPGGQSDHKVDGSLTPPTNTAPTASDGEVSTKEDTDYTFDASDFSFSDTDANDALEAVKVTSLPASGKGTLTLDGTAIESTDLPKTVTKAEIDDDKLKYTPPGDANGNDYTTFTFKVNDGDDDSASANTMTIDVDSVPDITQVAVTSTPRSGTTPKKYGAGEKIQITATFDEAVTVTGDPVVNVEVGSNSRPAAYARGSGTTALVFEHTVVAADADSDGVSIDANALTLDSNDKIEGSDNDTADIAHAALAAQSAHPVDGSLTPPEPACTVVRPANAIWAACLTIGKSGAGIVRDYGYSTRGGDLSDKHFDYRGVEGVEVTQLTQRINSRFLTFLLGTYLPGSNELVLSIGEVELELQADGSDLRLSWALSTNAVTWTDANIGDVIPVSLRFKTAPQDLTPPTLQSATVDGAELVLTYDERLHAQSGSVEEGAFTVRANGASVNFAASDAVSRDGDRVILKLAEAVGSNDRVTVSYRRPHSTTLADIKQRIRDLSHNLAASFSDFEVENVGNWFGTPVQHLEVDEGDVATFQWTPPDMPTAEAPMELKLFHWTLEDLAVVKGTAIATNKDPVTFRVAATEDSDWKDETEYVWVTQKVGTFYRKIGYVNFTVRDDDAVAPGETGGCAAATGSPFWSACMEVGSRGLNEDRGFEALRPRHGKSDFFPSFGGLSKATVEKGGNHVIDGIVDHGSGTGNEGLSVSFAADPRPAANSWVVKLGSKSFNFSDAGYYLLPRRGALRVAQSHTYHWTDSNVSWSSEDKVTVSLFDIPKPTGVSAAPGDRQATLSWTAPSGVTATDYEIRVCKGAVSECPEYKPHGAPPPYWEFATGSATTSGTVTRFAGGRSADGKLVNGVTYTVQVRAVTANGKGGWSDRLEFVPVGNLQVLQPAAPAIVGVTPGGLEATLAWEMTEAVEGITGWQVRYGEFDRNTLTVDGWGEWTDLAGAGGDARSYTVTGLSAGTDYGVQLRAMVGALAGAASPMNLISGVLPEVTGLAAAPAEGAVALRWTAPSAADDIRYWQVRWKAAEAAAWGNWTNIADSTATTAAHTVTGLDNGTRYAFRVRAIAINNDPFAESGTVEAWAGGPPAPGAPALLAKAGVGQVTLTWTAPESAAPITGWQLRYGPTGAEEGATASEDSEPDWGEWTAIEDATAGTAEHIVTGLENGAEYAFELRALAGDLVGESSVRRLARPDEEEIPPFGDSAVSGVTATTVGLEWILPEMPEGMAVTRLRAMQREKNASGEWQAWRDAAELALDATSTTVTGLSPATLYQFRIVLETARQSTDSGLLQQKTLAADPLDTRMTGSVPEPDDGTLRAETPAQGCAVEVAVRFLDADGNAVAVDALAASDFTAENGQVGAPESDADGLRWTVPVRATAGFTGPMRVRLPETGRWQAAEQAFRVAGDSDCAPVARDALASLALDGLDLDPAFDAGTTAYTAAAPADRETVTVKAAAVYGASEVTVAPADADEDADGHQVALAEGETAVTVAVTPADGSAAKTWTVTVTREAGAGVLTGFVLVDASNDADLGAVESGGTVSVSADGIYGVRAGIEENAEVGSVVLSLVGPGAEDTHTRTENIAPYSLYGDAPGGANGRAEHGRALAAGSYTLTATAYAARGGTGDVLGTLTVPFTVEVEAPPPPSAGVLTGFVLVDASTDADLGALTDGGTVPVSEGGSYGIRAGVEDNATVGSVVLTLAGPGAEDVHTQTENIAPYSLYGDAQGAEHGRALAVGSYTLTATAYAERGASGAVLGTLSVSFQVPGPAALSVADARVEEGPGATLDFAVTLDREAANTVTVAYATADGTATAGQDYTATSGTLTFQPGERAKTVSVPVLEDDHDEGSETLTLRLANIQGATVADGEGTGTITNSDAIPEAWLARFGRTVTGQVLDAVEARLSAPRQAGAQASLAGQALPSWRPGPGVGAGPGSKTAAVDNGGPERRSAAHLQGRDAMETIRGWMADAAAGRNDAGGRSTGAFGGDGRPGFRPGFRSWALTPRDFLTGTSFALTAPAGDGRGAGHVSLWGRGAIAGFDGREGALSLDGEVTTGLIGADWASGPESGAGPGSGRWIAGLAIGHSTGTGGYRRGGCTEGNCGGVIEASLTGLYPYAGMELTDRLSVWAAAGYGAGEVTVTPEGGSGLTADLTMAMGAAGLRSALLRPGDGDGLSLDLKGDARFTRTSSDAVRSGGGNLEATEADVWLIRAGVEGSRPVALGESGATLTPSFEIGLRLDGGDAETGMGADLGGGLAFSDPENGVALDLRARGLVAHQSPGFREWGASVSASWDPRPSTDRGLSLSLTQSWGASPAGGMNALLSRETLAGLAANDNPGKFEASSRLEGEIGYGLPAFGGRFTGTPNVGFALSDGGAREWRLGWRLTSAIAGDPGFEVSLDATRRELANDEEPEHGAMLRATIRW